MKLAVIDGVAKKYDWPKGKTVMLKNLVERGVPLAAAVGMMGNAKVESAGYNPGIEEFVNKIGYGYFQWSFGRRDSLEASALRRGVDVADPDFQIGYAIRESKRRTDRDNPKLNEWETFIKITDPREAAAYWQWNFERPSVKPGQSARTKEANKVYKQIMNALESEAVVAPQPKPTAITGKHVRSNEKPEKLPSRLTDKEEAAFEAARELGLTSGDFDISRTYTGRNSITIEPDSAIKVLSLEPYGGYPRRLRELPLDAIGTEYNVYSRECVDYVARRTDHDGMGMGWPRWGGRISEGYGGVAYKWISNAKQDGIRVDMKPAVGSTLAWDRSGRDHVKFGHVAYVEAVLSDGSVIISQYNNGGTGKYSVELLTKEYYFNNGNTAFIHFEEGRNADLPRNTRPHDSSN
jgi:surface antigen